MNSPAHWLSLFSAIMHLTIGLTELFRIGTRFLPPSWAQIYALVPYGEWLYPSTFVITGVVALGGVMHSDALRWGWWMSAAIFAAWGIAGLYAYSLGAGGNIQGSFSNFLLAGCEAALGYYVSVGTQSDRVNQISKELLEKVEQTSGR